LKAVCQIPVKSMFPQNPYDAPPKSRAFVEEYVLNFISPETLKKQMTDILFERDYTIFD